MPLRVNITRGYSSVSVTAMYGNDLSSRSRMLKGGPVALDEVLLEWSASASVRVTMTSTSSTRSVELSRSHLRVSALEVAADARAQRLRLPT
jgi:hypothetical protein